jgi:hypothetical protein
VFDFNPATGDLASPERCLATSQSQLILIATAAT